MSSTPSRPERIVWPDGRVKRIEWRRTPMKDDGETDQPFGDIRVKATLDEREQALVLLHEILHNVLWPLNSEDEEHIVALVECGLGAVWRNNGGLFAWLHDKLNR